jgi:hypothetical protein
VSKILRRVERRVLKRMEKEVRGVRAKQHAQVQFILGQAIEAWRKSKETEPLKVVTGPGRRDGVATTRTRRTTNGDPRFLRVALQALAAERQLFGLDGTMPPAGAEGPPAVEATRRRETIDRVTETVTIRRGGDAPL